MPAPEVSTPPSPERKAAFKRGVVAVLIPLIIGPALLVGLGKAGLLQDQSLARIASSLIMAGSIATAWIGLGQLRQARAGLWDGFAVLSLAVMATAVMTLMVFLSVLALLWLGGSWLE